MFYIGDTYTTISTAWAADKCMGRKIPIPIDAAVNLKFYLYGAHTFTTSNKL
jgi:hypothetical protein